MSITFYGYQPLPPRKSFRLCGHITFDPDAPLNIAEAQGLNELDSQYWVGDTLSNQRIMPDHSLTDEEKRTFALLYGPGGFKPDHITVRPEPKPEEPVQFSVTIGPRKEYERKAPPPQGYVNPMKVEGESWILGNRERDCYYGGHHPTLHATQTGGEHLAFHRPRHFPPHIPQWARQRMEQQGRGEARSLDRSLFAPAWSKVPQPQPPFWVKRDGSKVAGGFEMSGQKLQNETERVKKQEEEQGESFGQKIQQQDRTQPQQAEFKTEQDVPQQKSSQEQFHKSTQQPATVGQQKFAGGQIPQKRSEQQNAGQMTQQSGQQNEQIKEESQQQMAPKQTQPFASQNVQYNQPKQSQQIAYGQGGGGTFSRKMQQIHQQPKMQTNSLHYQKDAEQDQATRQNTEGGQWTQFTQPGGIDYVGQNQQQQRTGQGQQFNVQQPNYQLIVNPPKIHQGGIMPAKQPLTQRQEQQQQVEQQQKYYEFYEGRPMGQKQQQPSQIKKVEEKRQLGSSPDVQQWTQFNQPGGIDYRQGVRPQSSAGNVHNLPSRNTRIVQQSGEVPLNTNEETSGLENLAKIKLGEFPLRQQSSLEEQQASAAAGNEKIFVDAHGRPVQYVKETKLNPSTGQPVTREEWRLLEQQQSGGPSSGNYQFRQPQMNPAQTANGIQQQPKAGGFGDAQWSQFNKPGGMYYGQQ